MLKTIGHIVSRFFVLLRSFFCRFGINHNYVWLVYRVSNNDDFRGIGRVAALLSAVSPQGADGPCNVWRWVG